MEQKLLAYLCDELQKKLGTNVLIKEKHALGGGCISNSLMLQTSQGDFFLKWNFSCADDLFIREAECLEELKKKAGDNLIVPEVILAKELDSLPGLILLEFFPSGNTSGQDERLGRGLAQLHEHTDNQFGFYHNNYCGATKQNNTWQGDWIQFFSNNRMKYLLDLIEEGREIHDDEMNVFKRLIRKLPDLLPAHSKPSLIHGDLWSGNYIYTTQGPAIIDPASYYADREMELSIMTMFGGFSAKTWSAYKEYFPLDYGWEDRVQIYQLYHILNHYFLFGGSYLRQALSIARKYC